ncbi:polysaccharide biosynthesis protein [Alkalibacillus haloalkaliphilus]|uniref:UDP-N-acetylglucosamine 4,6-dehydratase n=1 Tax=Alkalibacillus haloalkaliphilus TaxID=94136 RepID=A0A511W6F4_9BACI|nr:nucleoside-diphosphate sugar epimerase/dehydratase [Alkalibacillus haloalkaliphilus]GEN46674.1 UDP-N-acetylglucosamine 4,6-dehydratase [Alkalibacillus haloalkaliphilus]
MTYRKRLSSLIFLDTLIVLGSIYLSTLILYNTFVIDEAIIMLSSAILLAMHHLLAMARGLYHKVWEYASIRELMAIFYVVTLSIAVTAMAQLVIFGTVYIRALAVAWMLHILLIGGSRFAWRIIRDEFIKGRSKGQKRTLVVGAGAGGAMVARQLQSSDASELNPVAFIDDDFTKKNMQLLGIPVAGKVKHLKEVVEDYDIDHIIIAIPSLTRERLNEIFSKCSETKVKTQIIPKFEDLATGKISVSQLRDVEVEDLLGRDPIDLDMDSIAETIGGRTVLITGAGGSIGSEICRQIAPFEPEHMIILGHGENSIYQIERDLRNRYEGQFTITPIIADIKDRDRIFEIMKQYKPDVVYHAAAHKHVPLMEFNPREAVKNNVFGTKNVADAADEHNVGTFVLVSTDKAVNPTNVMGATKRVAEMIIQNLSQRSETRFLAVRFGNVLGSRGSVIPLFKEQIRQGGPVTVTDPEMTRYFMTIPEASQLVIQAGSLARGGEIFVLDMGEPVKIVDLAKNLIKLSGYTHDEIGIEFTGIRPGEKMYEELLGEDEISDKQVFPKIYIGKCTFDNVRGVHQAVDGLLENNEDQLKGELMEFIEVKPEEVTELA